MKYDLRNAGLLKAIFSAKLGLADSLRSISMANFAHLGFVYDSHSVAFPVVLATLRHFIRRVVSASTKEKMVWANARRVVAMVQNAHTVGNWAYVKHPRVSVSALNFGETSIAVAISPSLKLPTADGYNLNLRQKLINTSTGIRAKQSGVITAPRMKRFLTLLAKTCYFESTHCENLRNRFELWLGSVVASIGGRAVVILT